MQVKLKVREEERLRLKVEGVNGGGILSFNYNNLINKPTLDGEEIVDDVHEKDPTVPSWAKNLTRPVYTADEIGALAQGSIEEIGINELAILWEEL